METATTLRLPSSEELLARAGAENFVVAPPWLPEPVRRDLRHIYGFARLVDELGDSYEGDRLAALDHVIGETRQALADPVSAEVHPAGRRWFERREKMAPEPAVQSPLCG